MKFSNKIGWMFCLTLMVFTTRVKAQFITLPDPLFADFIAITFPSAVNASKQLDTNAAKTITGNFVCKWQNITSAEGVQYFHNITRLDLTGNNLTTIPDISNLSNLDYLKVDSNQIHTLPPINGLSALEKFYCRKNKLSVIPSLAGLTNLESFFCDNNKLTTLPDLTGCTALYHIIGSDNKITYLPDLSTLTSLNRLLLTNNLLTSVDLSMLPTLEDVHLKYNRLTSFPNITGLSQLTEVYFDQNLIDSLPDLSGYPNLSDFKIYDNKLTFEDLIPLTGHPNFSSFQISPQKAVALPDSIQKHVGDSITLIASIDTSLSGNTYSWYKDGMLIASNATGEIHWDSLTLSDNGIYTYEIRNNHPLLSGIVLTSHPVKLAVLSCFDASQLETSVSNNDCKNPAQVQIDEATIFGGTSPYSYTLTNLVTGHTLTSSEASFSIPSEGIFDLTITDQTGCMVLLKSKISVSRSNDCEAIFYPDLDGPGSSYFIETAGVARVYTKEGKMIREMQSPAFWDGRNSAGELMDSGIYMIIVNEQIKLQVSLMRIN